MKHILSIALLFSLATNIKADQWPIPDAGNDVTVKSCRIFTLDGSKTKNVLYPDLQIKWIFPKEFVLWQSGFKTQFIAPDVSVATTYSFQLYSYNSKNISVPDEVKVTVLPNDSIAKPNMVADKTTMNITNSNYWNISLVGSTDPYNLPLNVKLICPDGSTVKYPNSYLNVDHGVPLNNLTTETYIYKLVVQNCRLSSDTAKITVSVTRDSAFLNRKPTVSTYINGHDADLLDSVYLPYDTIFINANGGDYFNKTIIYKWTSLDGAVLNATDKANVWFVAPDLAYKKDYRFVVEVDNGTLKSIPDTIIATVSTPEQQAESYVDFGYHDLQSIFGLNFQFVYYAFDDRAVNEGQSYTEFQRFKISENNGTCQALFQKITCLIYRMNESLVNLDYCTIDATLRQELKAEAKFLRSMAYFYLVNMFKNPLLVTNKRQFGYYDYTLKPYSHKFSFKPDTIFETTPDLIYAQIKKDLNEAYPFLPSSRDSINKHRATKGAALSLLGKACLYNQEWSAASTAFKSVLDSAWYNLILPLKNDSASYVDAFSSNFMPPVNGFPYKTEYNTESVFEVEFNSKPAWNLFLSGYASEGNISYSYFAVNGYQNIGTKQILAAQYENVAAHPAGLKYDPRKYATIYFGGDTIRKMGGVNYPYVVYQLKASLQGNGLKKYYSPIRKTFSESSMGDGDNWRLIRYSDVLLMYAEALYHAGNETEAWKQLNKVRQRVGLPDNSGDFAKALIHERDVELAMECIRFFDIVRWNKLPQPWIKCDTILQNFVINQSEYLPIAELFYSPYFTDVKWNDIKKTEIIGSVKAHDPDGDDNKITYAILPINNSNDYFYMAGNTIRAKYDASMLLSMGADTTKPFIVTISAIDETGLRGGQNVNISFKSIPQVLKIRSTVNDITSVFPNPSSSSITISNISDMSRIFIFDINGKTVEILRNDKNPEIQINIEKYPAGVYFIYMMGENSIPVTKKFIKE
jgi:starch-binding outer membrane protein, SusD/RagB family